MEAFDQFVAKLVQLHAIVVARWKEFEVNITGGDSEAAERTIDKLHAALTDLIEMLPGDASPKWLNTMVASVENLSRKEILNHTQHRVRFVSALYRDAPKMLIHDFKTVSDELPLPFVNLDEIVAEHHDQDAVNKFYDQAIDTIKTTLASGQVDSKRITQDLQRILTTIKLAKDSSFVNQRWQIPNLMVYLNAIAKVSARKIPGISFIIEVIEEAESKLETSNEQILQAINELAASQANEVLTVIEHQPDASVLIEGEIVEQLETEP